MTYFRIKPGGPTLDIPPDPAWDNAEGFKSMRMEETTDVSDPERDLASLTDAHVRALLDPGGCSDEDFMDAAAAGLVVAEVSINACDYPERRGSRHTDDGDRILAEAQRIAEGLDDVEAEMLGGVGIFHINRARRLIAIGLIIEKVPPPYGDHRVSPAGRLVLALRERSR